MSTVKTVVAALAILTFAASGSAGVAPAAALRCSLVPIPLGRDTAASYFVGTATADTVLAGPGTVEPGVEAGHWGTGASRAVYGQVVRVDTLGGAHAAALRGAITRAGTADVVVVPWDYDPGCKPTFWNRSARWVEPGLVGFYRIRLRDPSAWASGRPTFDAFHASLQPYPHGAFFQAGYRGTDAIRTRPSLDAVEMFAFYEGLPTYREREHDPLRASERITAWQRAHPDLARKYPADEVIAAIQGRTRRAP